MRKSAVRYTDSRTPLVSNSDFQASSHLSYVAVQTGCVGPSRKSPRQVLLFTEREDLSKRVVTRLYRLCIAFISCSRSTIATTMQEIIIYKKINGKNDQ